MRSAPNIQLANIPDGARGTRRTLEYMAGFVRSSQGRLSPHIRAAAIDLVSECPPKHLKCEIFKIHQFVRDEIKYIRDINNVETIHTPEKVLEFGIGDCDDKSLLISALLESIGFRTRFVALGWLPNRFCHVIAEVLYKGRWIPLETTEDVKVGWYPKKLKHRMVQNV